MLRYLRLRMLAASFLLWLPSISHAAPGITVYAAASLAHALTEIGASYQKQHAVEVRNSFAASSALARQIEHGAPADVYLSADGKWMDYLQRGKRIKAGSRVNLLTNRLVLIAPKGSTFPVQMDKSFDFAHAFSGKLCTGEVESVPVGIYARQALANLGWWHGIQSRIVGSQDVRAALAFVERGECDAGIVYETDAKASAKVDIVAVFPANSHEPIIYPAALVDGAPPAAQAYLEDLQSPAASAIFTKYGFTPLAR
ncbi:MAG TPA: molybdate ABC transporter substrate-binding protein [Methylophilaceae bacterium]|nr:molybdate ABC transporter substrate-binding protein [Methylophilaceae bacterium]